MTFPFRSRWCAAAVGLLVPLALLGPLAAIAQPGVNASRGPTRPDPGEASAPVPPVVHRSAFTGYRPQRATPSRDWKASNDDVGRIGGWKAYAREANEAPESSPAPTAAPATPAAPAPAPAPGHGGAHAH